MNLKMAAAARTAVLGTLALAAAAGVGVAAECQSCRSDCPEGTTNCWSCGKRVRGSENPAELVAGKLTCVDILTDKGSDGGGAVGAGAIHDPSGEVAAVEKWIDAHPDDYAGGLRRLDQVLDSVRGTVYEARVEDRIARIRSAAEEASKPMTPEEREKKAASEVAKVAARVRRRDDAPAENIRELEQLLAVARGTSYEAYVRQLLETQKAKLNR